AAPKAAFSLWSITTLSSLLVVGCSSIALVRGNDRPSEMQQPARPWGQHEQFLPASALDHHFMSKRTCRLLRHCRNSSGNGLQHSRENLQEKTAQVAPRQPGVPRKRCANYVYQ
ncbi:hypothetical protein CTAM01_13891, partial [Colletotrichum tamarilloi]